MAGRPDHPSSVTRRVPGTHHDAGWILPTALGLSVMLVPMIVGLRYAGADAPDPDANAANARSLERDAPHKGDAEHGDRARLQLADDQSTSRHPR